MRERYVVLLFLIATFHIPVEAQNKDKIAETPPMGWNSWNWHGKKDINERIVRETIDAIVEEGLRDAGYIYIVVDGGWRDTKLGAKGELQAHPEKFPGGMKVLADYAHSKGLKFGVHVVPGTHDCGGDPVGGFGREKIHVRQFEEWGLDFIKLDLCRQTEDPCKACIKSKNGWSEKTIKDTYLKWNRLLKQCNRDILFSISAYQYRDWYPDACNMARTTGDIQGRIHRGGALFNPPEDTPRVHYTVMEIADSNNLSAEAAGKGYWNDPDMMVTGEQGLSRVEQESHFALWCIMSSPLILGNDPRNMSEFEKDLVLNKEMIAINQDPTEQGRIIQSDNDTQIWAKKLRNNKTAVLFLNLDKSGPKDMTLILEEIGLKGMVSARDVVHAKDLGSFKNIITQTADTHQCRLLLLSE